MKKENWYLFTFTGLTYEGPLPISYLVMRNVILSEKEKDECIADLSKSFARKEELEKYPICVDYLESEDRKIWILSDKKTKIVIGQHTLAYIGNLSEEELQSVKDNMITVYSSNDVKEDDEDEEEYPEAPEGFSPQKPL